MSFFEQVFSILIKSPGNLIYHLVLAFSIVGALSAAFTQWRNTEFPQARRTVIGLSILLAGQVLVFLVSVMAWQRLINPDTILPPLDRAITLFSLIWILWLWAFPEPVRNGDVATTLLNLLTGAGLAFTLLLRMQANPSEGYNATIDNLGWEGFTLACAALGILIIARRRPSGWNNGLTMMVLMFIGHLVGVLIPNEGHYSGVVRLMNMAAYPILLTLPQRFPTSLGGSPRREEKKGEDDSFRERRRYSTDPKTLHAMLDLASETDANKINDHIARSISQALLADLCFLIYTSDDRRNMIIASGYDLIREERLDGGLLDKDAIPLLSNAVQRSKPLRLPASSTSSDLKGLGDLLGLGSPGNLLFVPITSEKGAVGGILMLSPYSNRMWSVDDQTFLMNIAGSFVPIIERGRRISEIQIARERAENAVSATETYARQMEKERDENKAELETLRLKLTDTRLQTENLAAVLKAHEELQIRYAEVLKEVEDLKTGMPMAISSGQLEDELRLTLKEVARLQNQLADTNMKILELEKRPAGGITGEQAEVVASISQELRQPMSSIVGYADLLLGESVGILGALQRKFIERIKASTERIGSLIDDLIQVTAMETGTMALKPEPVDLNLIIDNAMAYTSSQLREKNIALRIDLPQNLAPMQADREALQQILIHLLQNAGAATPVEGTVTLRVRTQKEHEQEFVLIQVTDTGGGIPSEDLPRVFSRLYRADNVLIQGVGDTGVGLSIAKTLTEAQNGRILVESDMGSGSTFSVLLPINYGSASAKEG